MILNEVMKETADAIREKKGTTDKIAPINFAEEIKGITAGGGGGGGLSYFAIDTSILGADVAFAYGAFLGKVVLPEGSTIQPTLLLVQSADENLMKSLKAIATDVNAKVYFMGQLVPLWGGLADTIEYFISEGILTPITEAEFYDLNA